MATILGIDLGTTNSLVALVREGVPVVLPDPHTGSTLLPSVVHFPQSGAPQVGDPARAFLASDPQRTVYSAKRLMGRGVGDADAVRGSLPYPLTDDCRIALEGREPVSPPEVAARILAALKARAEAYLGEPASQAVITVPAYFNDAQRQATKDAGELAGLEVVRIVNEPTAASLAYGLQNRKSATIAVYDLGGGTFDVSILRLDEGLFEVLSTAGDTRLGGDDFDLALAGERAVDPAARLAAEEAKRTLSEKDSVELLGATVTRADFERVVAPLIERTLTICRQALADASLTPAEIDAVVLVGGSTRVPAVRRAVETLFQREPYVDLNPDEVVALGAAIQADILAGNRTDTLLLDVTPLSLGLETLGGAVEKLLFRNARVPSSAKEEFTTSADGQTKVLLHVVQGEREMARDNRSLARIELTGIPPLPAGIPRIEVRFLLDANGILKVSARELRSGARTEVRVKPTYGLDETEVKRRVRDSFVNADEDFAERMKADMRTEAGAAVQGARKLLRSHGDTLEAPTRARVEARLAELEEAMESAPDHTAIRASWDRLEEAARPLAEAAMSGVARTLVGGKTLAEAAEALGGTGAKTGNPTSPGEKT